jgi:hypothetical protein
MASVTRAQLISDTREYMDAVQSTRWSDSFIQTVLNAVYDAEWSNILNAAPYYRFAQRQVTTDVNGQVPLTALDAGGGDSQQLLYRIMSVSDGNVLYEQTQYVDVPLAATGSAYYYDRLYYLTGTTLQVLPVGTNVTLTVGLNYKPTALADLSSGAAVLDWPANSHLVLVYQGAYQLLLKGGAEAQSASYLKKLAEEERATLLDDLRRQTTFPTRMAYPDTRIAWGG